MLDLAEWVAGQLTTGSERDEDNPGNWTWARRVTVDVANDAVVAAGADDRRTRRAWEIVRTLLADADPTTERAREAAGDNSFTIDTVRGQALQAAIKMVSAISRPGSDPKPAVVQEILSELERRTNPAVEPSSAIRSVLPQQFNTLFLVDREWARALARSLFPTAEYASEERWGAWQTFLTWNRPFVPVFQVLREHYDLAVDTLAGSDPKAAEELGEHLAWLAAWGAIGPESSDGLLPKFVDLAPSPARHHALDSLGRALHRTTEPIPPEDVGRLKRLWEWWSESASKRDDATDLSAFGWWFTSPVFDASWSLATLTHTLDATHGGVDWGLEVAKKLAELAKSAPEPVATCLAKFVDGQQDSRVPWCRESIREALRELRLGPATAAAKEIASRLVARGWRDFLDLA